MSRKHPGRVRLGRVLILLMIPLVLLLGALLLAAARAVQHRKQARKAC